jgi:hypothetical protein
VCLLAAWQLALHCFGPPALTSRPKSCGVLARLEKVQGPLPARDSVSLWDHDPRRHGVSQRQWRCWREGSRQRADVNNLRLETQALGEVEDCPPTAFASIS